MAPKSKAGARGADLKSTSILSTAAIGRVKATQLANIRGCEFQTPCYADKREAIGHHSLEPMNKRRRWKVLPWPPKETLQSFDVATIVATWLTAEPRPCELGLNAKDIAASAIALCNTCSIWSEVLRSPLKMLHANDVWRLVTGQLVASYLCDDAAGSITLSTSQRGAASIVQLYCTCSMWRRILEDPIDDLYYHYLDELKQLDHDVESISSDSD